MRNFLLNSCPVLIWVISGAQALIMVLALRGWREKKTPLYLLTALVAFGLFYDALIISLGSLLQNSPLFLPLSRFRFVAHGGLIPLLFPICACALNFSKPWRTLVWLITGIVIALGLAEGFATVLETAEVAGVVRCRSAETTPAWAEGVSMVLSFGTVIPLMIAGLVAWVKQKTPLLFLAGFLMFLFSALGPATGNTDLIFYVSMFGEVGMALCFLLYAANRAKAKV